MLYVYLNMTLGHKFSHWLRVTQQMAGRLGLSPRLICHPGLTPNTRLSGNCEVLGRVWSPVGVRFTEKPLRPPQETGSTVRPGQSGWGRESSHWNRSGSETCQFWAEVCKRQISLYHVLSPYLPGDDETSR